jgi:hypothetical protein
LPFVGARFSVAGAAAGFGALRSIFAILGASGFAARGSFRFSIMALFASQGIAANGNRQDKSQRDNQDERIFFQSNLLKNNVIQFRLSYPGHANSWPLRFTKYAVRLWQYWDESPREE